MERRTTTTGTPSSPSRTAGLVDAKMSLSLWLRTGRANKGLSLEAVAKITKIQPRILERLEAGKLEGLPAEVFVRGFVRSFARCVGLDEAEALERYTAAAGQPTAPTAAARALVESMSELAPVTATRSPRVLRRDPLHADADTEALDPTFAAGSLQDLPKAETVVEMLLPETGTLIADATPAVEPVVAVEVATAVEAPSTVEAAPTVDPVLVTVADIGAASPGALTNAEPLEAAKPSKKKRGGKGKNKRKAIATGTPSEPTPVVAADVAAAIEITPVGIVPDDQAAAPESIELAEGSTAMATPVGFDTADDTTTVASVTASDAVETTEAIDASIASTETWSPRMPTVVTPSVPWRRPFASATGTSAIVPTLVIDDADPESAERELEDRAASKEPARRSFLPPILLDREDRSARQGGLTLAVIILLIAATLTLSYLMRRPSSTGDGVTQIEAAHDIVASR